MSRIKPIKLTMAQKTALGPVKNKFGDPQRCYHRGNIVYCEFKKALFKWEAASSKWVYDSAIEEPEEQNVS